MRQQAATTRCADTLTETAGGESWLLIETPPNKPVSIVFDSGKVKRFTSVRRRQRFTQSSITTAITTTVDQVRKTGQPRHVIARSEFTTETHLRAEPVYGPAQEIFAVQVMISDTDQPERFRSHRRRCGAFIWDPSDQVFLLGPRTEYEVVGADAPATGGRRVSHEVFSLVEEFPRMAALGEWIADVMSGEINIDATFSGDVLLTGVDGRRRSAFVSLRPGRSGVRDNLLVRGLIHDITDVRAPDPASGHTAAMVRSTFDVVCTPDDLGIGHINLATGLILEWFRVPPKPLNRWCRQNGEFHPDDLHTIEAAIGTLRDGAVADVTLFVRVRFDDTTWIPVDLSIYAALAGVLGQGLLTVKHPCSTAGRNGAR